MKVFTIKENSFWARLAGLKLRTKAIAMVLGHCIHLYGVSKEEFLSNKRWLRHELKHIEQYERLGFIRFIITYLWQTVRVEYYRCGLECEAREAEEDATIQQRFILKY